MRILFFSHYYPPEVNAPASRTSEHCREWVRAGHAVTVITCAPNHPAGRIYPGYRNAWFRRETIDGVEVVRVWTFLAANQGFLLRILNYVSYLVTATLAVTRIACPDVIVSTSPQFFCGLAGYGARLLRRVPWVLEIRDLWPESIVTVGAMRESPVTRLLERLESFAYRRADRIVSVTDSFVPHINERGGDPARIAVIKNGVDLSLFRPAGRPAAPGLSLGFEGRFVVSYVGTHGMAHGLDTLLDATVLLADDPRIGILLVGDGAERARLVARSEALGLGNLRIVGQLPKADMPAVWSVTDASVIHLKPDPLFQKVIPSKMFEAMAMGCPIVLGVEGEARELLDAAGAGLTVAPGDAEALAGAIRRLAGDPELCRGFAESGQRFVRANFDRAVLAARYLTLLRDAAGPAR